MTLRNLTISSLIAGEVSRKYDGKIEAQLYKQACSTLYNCMVMSPEGVVFRPGTEFVAEVKDSSTATRLIPFVVSKTEAYIIEMGHEYFRVYKPHERCGTVQETTTYQAADLFKLKYLQIGNDLYIVHPTYPPRKITYTNETSWAIATITFTATGGGYTALNTFNSAGEYPRAIAFFADRLWLAGTNNDPATIYFSRYGAYTDFTTTDAGLEQTDAGSFEAIAVNKRTILWMEGISQGVVLGTLLGEGIVFPNSNGIVGGDASTMPNVRWQSTFGGEDIQGKLFARNLFFVQQGGKIFRDYLYGLDEAEETYFYSPDLTGKADHILGTDGVEEFTTLQGEVPSVWIVRGDGVLAVLTYDKTKEIAAWCRVVTDGEFESVAVIPKTAGEEVWCVVKREIDGSDVRYIEVFSPFETEDIEDYHGVDCGTVIDGGIDDIAGITAETVQDITDVTNANPAVVTCEDHGYSNADTIRLGDIVGMEELNGSEFTVANKTDDTFELSGINSTDYGTYESGGKVVKTPNITVTMTTALASLDWSDDDHVYFRDILGMTELNERRFVIEGVSGSDFDVDTLDTQEYTDYVSGGTAEKVVNEVTGLDELEGEEVTIFADGSPHAEKTVASGEIELDEYFRRIHVGLGYYGLIKSMRVEPASLLEKLKIFKLVLRLYKSLGIQVGPDEDNLYDINFRESYDALGTPVEPYTGDVEVAFAGTWGRENYIVIKHDQPTPMAILAIGARVAVSG